MLLSLSQPRPDVRLLRHWKTASAQEAAALVQSSTTIAVGWLSDTLATALALAFVDHGEPRDLTIVYGATRGDGRTHGLNLLAHEGLVRRVVGGQWYPVPGLQALAAANKIEAYSLPVGVINRLFRDVAAGMPGHLTRSGLGTFSDPRNGGGRLNRRTQEQLVRLLRPAGDEVLLFRAFPVDVALVNVAFMEGTGAIAMNREALAIARAARVGGGIVIAQPDRIGTLNKLPPGQVEVPDTLVDILVTGEALERHQDTFAPAAVPRSSKRLLSH